MVKSHNIYERNDFILFRDNQRFQSECFIRILNNFYNCTGLIVVIVDDETTTNDDDDEMVLVIARPGLHTNYV